MEDEVKTESDALARRISEAQHANDPKPARKPDSLAAQGMRIGVEMIAGVLVGLGLGLLVDGWLNSKPWGLIIFLLLGFAGGMLNVLRVLNGLGMGLGYKRPGRTRKD